jgi:hypothetical protein
MIPQCRRLAGVRSAPLGGCSSPLPKRRDVCVAARTCTKKEHHERRPFFLTMPWPASFRLRLPPGRRVGACSVLPALAEGIEPSSKGKRSTCRSTPRFGTAMSRPRADRQHPDVGSGQCPQHRPQLNSIRIVAAPLLQYRWPPDSQLGTDTRSFLRSAPSNCSSNCARTPVVPVPTMRSSGTPPRQVSPPTIEALHSKFQAGYSVAFISRGRAISEP